MELVVEAFNYTLVAILVLVTATWISLIRSMSQTFQKAPFLEDYEQTKHDPLKVSIILPARNEEDYIKKCIDSLLKQDYPNYEIIAIDDSSEDSTGHIIEEYAK